MVLAKRMVVPETPMAPSMGKNPIPLPTDPTEELKAL